MSEKDGYLGTLLGKLIVTAAAAFVFSGGQLGAVKKVESDKDLPPRGLSRRRHRDEAMTWVTQPPAALTPAAVRHLPGFGKRALIELSW